jgi:hypothetical protein
VQKTIAFIGSRLNLMYPPYIRCAVLLAQRFFSVSFFNSYNNYIESIQIDLAENASAFDRPFEAQQFYIFNSSVIAIARIYVNIIRRLCISQ